MCVCVCVFDYMADMAKYQVAGPNQHMGLLLVGEIKNSPLSAIGEGWSEHRFLLVPVNLSFRHARNLFLVHSFWEPLHFLNLIIYFF